MRRSHTSILLRNAGLVTVGFAACLALALALGSRPGTGYQPGRADDRPPADPRYEAALQVGVAGNLVAARREMTLLSRERRGTSAGAWSLYQAGLAAKATGDAPGAAAHFARLRRDYPDHPLALRTKPDPPAPPPRSAGARPYCGPEALLHVCRQAKIPATLPELVKRCRTDQEGTTLAALASAARQKGMKTAAAQVDAWFLKRHRPAGVAFLAAQQHYVAFGPGEKERFWLFDPNVGKREPVTASALAARSNGIVLLLAWGEKELPEVK